MYHKHESVNNTALISIMVLKQWIIEMHKYMVNRDIDSIRILSWIMLLCAW